MNQLILISIAHNIVSTEYDTKSNINLLIKKLINFETN